MELKFDMDDLLGMPMHQLETLYQSMVVMTPKVKVYGSKVKFSTWSYGDEI